MLKLPPAEALKEVRKEQARRSLKSFIQQGWYVLEPKPFSDNWHIGAVCEHLQAVNDGQIKKLLILIPPGTMKSLSVSVFWPAWVWGPRSEPETRWMFTSYTQALSTRDSFKCRQILRSNWYQERWGDKFNMLQDRDTLTYYYNDKNGYRIATSVEGLGTGERGNFVVADDPHNVIEAESDAKRNDVITWWDEAMTSRVNEPGESAFVIMMQRVHQKDLAGHVIEKGDYVVLQLPMEFEPGRRCYTILKPKNAKPNSEGKCCWDPRTEENELLWKDRYPREVVENMKRDMGSYASAAQFQMRPSPRGGGLIKLHWFQRYRQRPSKERILRIIQSWDTADKGGQQNAYSVCLTVAQTQTSHYILHVLRRRMNIPTLLRTAFQHAKDWNPAAVVVEDAASGTTLIQHFQTETRYAVFGMRAEKDKVTRMDVETPAVEAGNVYLPLEDDWLNDFEAECEAFPNSAYKDQVDALSQYLKWQREHTVEQDWSLH